MSDWGDIWRSIKEQRRQRRLQFGIDCPICKVKRPKTNPSRLLPGQECKVDGFIYRPGLVAKEHPE